MWNAPATLAMVGFLMAVAPAHSAAPAQPPTAAPVERSISGFKPVATIQVGKTADWVAITADAVWVGSTSPNAVHRIDPDTNREAASVSVPGEPCAGLVPGFGSLWVPLCAAKPALARIDLRSNRLVTVLGFGTAAECGITASEDSVWLVVDNHGTLARIDPAKASIRQTVKLPPGSCNPHYSEGVVWVTNAKGAELTAVDASSGAVVATIETGPHPRFLTDGAGSIWTLNQGDGSLTRIDMRSRRALGSIALGTPGHGGDIAFGGLYVWTTMAGTPLTLVEPALDGEAGVGTLFRQFVGDGGDSLAIGHGAIWLTDYHKGTIARYRIAEAASPFCCLSR
jgi:virginiamycin B lyase